MKTARLLLQNGSNVDTPTNFNVTPIYIASQQGIVPFRFRIFVRSTTDYLNYVTLMIVLLFIVC